MTVEELILELQKHDPSLNVWIEGNEFIGNANKAKQVSKPTFDSEAFSNNAILIRSS